MRMLIIFSVLAGLAVGCGRDASTASNFTINLSVPKGRLPKTVDEAVDLLIAAMPPDSQTRFAATRKSDLIQYHFGLGRLIRKEFGLWGGNPELLKSTGCQHPDDASMKIIERAWERLQAKK